MDRHFSSQVSHCQSTFAHWLTLSLSLTLRAGLFCVLNHSARETVLSSISLSLLPFLPVVLRSISLSLLPFLPVVSERWVKVVVATTVPACSVRTVGKSRCHYYRSCLEWEPFCARNRSACWTILRAKPFWVWYRYRYYRSCLLKGVRRKSVRLDQAQCRPVGKSGLAVRQ